MRKNGRRECGLPSIHKKRAAGKFPPPAARIGSGLGPKAQPKLMKLLPKAVSAVASL